jgi:predicted small lipoprotein YifL
MTELAKWPRILRAAVAVGCLLALAACGVDGEPEQPTRGTVQPAALVVGIAD